VRQQNSGMAEDFILLYSAVYLHSTNPKVKELLKSVHICQSYRKNKSGIFLWRTVYSPKTATIVAGDYSRRKRRQFVASFGDYSRQCGRGFTHHANFGAVQLSTR